MNQTSKEKSFYETASKEDREEIFSLIDLYKKSPLTLSEIFNTDPEIYVDIPIEKIGLSVRSSNAMRRCQHNVLDMKFRINTLCDLLHCTVFQLLCIRNFGMGSLFESLYTVKQYINSYKETFENNLTYSKDLDKNQVTYELTHILEDNPQKDLRYIMKISGSFSEFFAPIYRHYRYKQEIENLFMKLPPELHNKTARYFIQAYLLNNEVVSANVFNAAAISDASISDVVNSVCNAPELDYNTFNYISRFLLWLNFNFNIAIGDELRNALNQKPEHIRIKGALHLHKIERLYLQCGYDIVAVARAYKGKSRLVYKHDIAHLIGAENANILWHIISIIKYRTRLYHYSAETGVIIFNE